MHFEDIDSIEDLETVSGEAIWQNFERLTAFIYENNNFDVSVNTVKTWNKKRRQYDVIARKNNQVFLIECKKWAGNRYRLSALKKAIGQHKERTEFYTCVTGENAIPVIVTLVEEHIRSFQKVPIVPIWKLNAFISEFDHYTDEDMPDEIPSETDALQGWSAESPGVTAENCEKYSP
jgi:Holliday junction resolvase